MKGDADKFEQQLQNLADALCDDILAASDEEILREHIGTHDAQAVRNRVQTLIEAARMQAGKSRMARARAGATADQQQPLRVLALSLDNKRRLLSDFAASHEHLRNTLAARKGKDLPETDIDAMLQGLYELGVIDENGQMR